MEAIRTEFHNQCIGCGKSGSLLYGKLKDELFGVAGEWQFFHCLDCELVWLNPRPVDEDIEKLYNNYYTHDTGAKLEKFETLPWRKKIKYAVLASCFGYDGVIKMSLFYRALGKILKFIPGFKNKVGIRVGFINAKPGGKFLDVGSGNGDALLEMRFLGWDVYGIEPDKRAVDLSTSQGLKVFYGLLQQANYPDNYFDLIYMYNVIEHLPKPIEALEQLKRMLKPNGSLVIWTCSNTSLAHKIFKSAYRGLETSRHFYIFSPKSILDIGKKAGLRVKRMQTYFNEYIWRSSYKLFKHKAGPATVKRNLAAKIVLKILSFFWLLMNPKRGDDILVVFTK